MSDPVITLDMIQLSVAVLPALVTLIILWRWSMNVKNAAYALGRMLIQLLAIGYVLSWIFGASNGALVAIVLLIMASASAWIALRTVPEQRWRLMWAASAGVLLGGGLTLAVVTQLVLALDPWFLPRYMIPLAGMAFANAMTAISLSAERLYAELNHGVGWEHARGTAFQAAMIPVVNSLFAVGLVSLPGMMTGQILSGVSPLIAARYQIMIMCLIFAASGISVAVFLSFCRQRDKTEVIADA